MGCCSKSDEHADAFSGPLEKRSCTDVFCLFFFAAFLCGMGCVGYVGFTNGGHPYKLVYGVDNWGNTCNKQNIPIPHAEYSGRDLTGLTKIFYLDFMAFLNGGTPTAMCVSKCPNPESAIITTHDLKTYANESGLQLCRYDIAVNDYYNDPEAKECPKWYAVPGLGLGKHSAVLSYCVPDNIKDMAVQGGMGLVSNTASFVSILQCGGKEKDPISLVLEDLQATWREILYMSALAVGVSIVSVILMRFFAPVIVWTLTISAALGALVGTGLLWYRWFEMSTSEGEDVKDAAKEWLYYAIAASVGAFILLLILLIMRKRIGLVVQLFREASKAMARMPMLLFQPVWTLIVLVFFVGVIGLVYSYAETSGEPIVNNATGEVTFTPIEVMKYMKWYYLFGFLWVVQLIFACHQLALAGAVAQWYFSQDKKDIGWPILASVKRLIAYHLGSAAFGAFIIALVQFLRIILAMVTKRLRGRSGKLVEFMLKCMALCLWCFEKIIKFLNRNAYIMVAIYGYNFCKAARRAFTLLVSNALRVAAINSVGTFVLILAKLGVAAVPVVVGLELLKSRTELCHVCVPLTMVGIVSLLIAHMFLSVYNMAIDTIFLCFCEDCERNDGIIRPYFMSKSLMEYVSNASKAIAALKKHKEAETQEQNVVVTPHATVAGQSSAEIQ